MAQMQEVVDAIALLPPPRGWREGVECRDARST